MTYRLEMQTQEGWKPAMGSEKASLYEDCGVAFEDAKKVQAARPLAAVRVVEAASGVVVWMLGGGDHVGEVFGPGPNAAFLNGEPDAPVTTWLEGKPVNPQPTPAAYPPVVKDYTIPTDPDVCRRKTVTVCGVKIILSQIIGGWVCSLPSHRMEYFRGHDSRNLTLEEATELARELVRNNREWYPTFKEDEASA